MKKYILFLAISLTTACKGVKGEPGTKGDQGDAGSIGSQGPTGDTGSKGDTGNDGTPGLRGPTGAQGPNGDIGTPGADGKDGTKLTVVQFCLGTEHYPSVFPEVGFCIDNKLYGVFWMNNNAFMGEIPPGAYSSTSTSLACTFTVADNCEIVR